ncbi:MAG TPA: hypothetical protein VFX11_03080 [Candidatus Kapabacteria bacterium]|nr:hypothetical protein [Candidatus Kapabacteria bacterium]
MNRSHATLLTLVVIITFPLAHARQDSPSPQTVSAKQLHYVGTATRLDTVIPAYTESYTEHYDAQGNLLSGQVRYQDAQGEPLADKQLDYRPHPHAPAFSFHNRKTGYREAVIWRDDGRILLMNADAAHTLPREKILRVPEPVVADAGFNRFVQDNLARLEQGERIEFHFLNPARLDWFRFSASGNVLDQQNMQVVIAPANPVLQWLVEPIRLVYARDSGRLLQYEGITNISLDGGDTLVARIQYRYSMKPVEYPDTLPEG